MSIGALVPHHADGTNVGEDGKGLPDLSLETRQSNLFAHDCICILQQRNALGRHLADDSHAETWTRERLAPHDLIGQPEFTPELAHLVLEQRAEWFAQLECHVFRKSADVVVTLDHARLAVHTTTFNHVGIQRALDEELRIRDATRVLLEDAHEQLPNRLALGFWFGHSAQLLEEAAPSIHVDEFDPHVALERLDHLCTFVLAHEAGVDVHARQLLADRLVHECRRNR